MYACIPVSKTPGRNVMQRKRGAVCSTASDLVSISSAVRHAVSGVAGKRARAALTTLMILRALIESTA
jgi:hypothetical protein